MNPNTYSTRRPAGRRDGLAALAAAVDGLAAEDLAGLPDAVRAERVLELRRLLDRLEGRWLNELASVDARGAAGADRDEQAHSTAAWLRNRLRLGAGAAAGAVRRARVLFRGPLAATADALVGGQISVAHARVLADGTSDLPDHHRRGRTGAAGGGPAARPAPAAAGARPPPAGRRPRRRRPHPRAAS